jgi:hypothetical protein
LEDEIETIEKEIQKDATNVARQENGREKKRSERARVWVNQMCAGFLADSEICDFIATTSNLGTVLSGQTTLMDIDTF